MHGGRRGEVVGSPPPPPRPALCRVQGQGRQGRQERGHREPLDQSLGEPSQVEGQGEEGAPGWSGALQPSRPPNTRTPGSGRGRARWEAPDARRKSPESYPCWGLRRGEARRPPSAPVARAAAPAAGGGPRAPRRPLLSSGGPRRRLHPPAAPSGRSLSTARQAEATAAPHAPPPPKPRRRDDPARHPRSPLRGSPTPPGFCRGWKTH